MIPFYFKLDQTVVLLVIDEIFNYLAENEILLFFVTSEHSKFRILYNNDSYR